MAKSKTGFKKCRKRSHCGQRLRPEPGQTDTASHRGGAGAREPRGAARWGSLQSEPPQRLRAVYNTPSYAGNTKARGRPAEIRCRITELTAHRHSASIQNDCKHHGAQPGRQYGARSRHPAHHDDAQRDRGDPRGAASRNQRGCSIPMETSPRAPRRPRLAPVSSVGRGDRVPPQTARPQKGSAPSTHATRAAPPPLTSYETQAPSSTRTTGPSTSSRRASAPSSRRSGSARTTWRTPTPLQLVPRPSPSAKRSCSRPFLNLRAPCSWGVM